MGHHQVVRNGKEPGDEGAPGDLVATQRSPGLEKNLLGKVLGVGGVGYAIEHMSVHLIVVTVVQVGKCILVARDCACDQCILTLVRQRVVVQTEPLALWETRAMAIALPKQMYWPWTRR